jgi:hypothetical protein
MERKPDRPGGGAVSAAFVLGLDLGQTTDYTALAVGELVPTKPVQVLIRHLERLPKQTPYPVQVATVGEKVERVKDLGRTLLVVDQTGVGRAVVDSFRVARLGVPMWPVTIAGSQMGHAKRDPTTADWVVPKKDLIGAMVSLAHAGQLQISGGISREMQRIAKEELKNFRMKITAAANVSFEAWREGDHDDVVLAMALVCWAAQRWATPGGLL